MNTVTTSIISIFILLPSLVNATEHNHNHNHFNPALEALGNDIISLTVCYNNGHLSEEDQEPAFINLINHANVDGEELGMYYMNSLGTKAEEIMASEQGQLLWNETFCNELTLTYLDVEKLKEKETHNTAQHGHDHRNEEHSILSTDIVEQDIERGRLLYIN
ncbi:hypothetical protein GCM10007916_12440 [Psychromonas marina]|uniref:Secreted protein n=1 Tax=Psychromonas marina TaxID=88364 RepID=A0ABQ6DYL3_9GAMM|nr:hypothetical protein [Psychromonas marina]GLS90177.1 hypothetical protein GCM10007916_12440 [Psychromonas marina]